MDFRYRHKFVQNRKSVCFTCRKITNQGVKYDKYRYDLAKDSTIKYYIMEDVEDVEDGSNVLYIAYPKNQTDKRKHMETFIQNCSICSRCNKKMVLVGSEFKVPKYKDKKQWTYWLNYFS